ncbi:MAG: SRPBCC family protein, partial [Solirubrobacterales bacterium]
PSQPSAKWHTQWLPMSVCRSQALINASPNRIWDLVGDPQRHPEWWPRVIEVRGEQFDEGDNYAQVSKSPTGQVETMMKLERLADLREIQMRCTKTGTYARWLLTEAQGNTFVEVEFGMDPIGVGNRVFDSTFGKLYFRRWLSQSLAALEEVAAGPKPEPGGVAPARDPV